MGSLDMDHRWGVRRSLNLRVQLVGRAGLAVSGLVTDISLSGAFVRTELLLPVQMQVQVVLVDQPRSSARPVDLVAYVIRHGRNGIGLEWWNLAPAVLHRILALPQPGSSRPRERHAQAGMLNG